MRRIEVRIVLQGPLILRDRIWEAARHLGQGKPEIDPVFRAIGLESNGSLEFGDRLGFPAAGHQDYTQIVVDKCARGIPRESFPEERFIVAVCAALSPGRAPEGD